MPTPGIGTNDPRPAPSVAPTAFAAALPTGSPKARLIPKSNKPPTIGTLFNTGLKNFITLAPLARPIPAASKPSAPKRFMAAF